MAEGRFSSGLSLASRERLYLLLEELGEAQQAIGKILRHGYESFSPFDPKRTSNRQLLERELGDVMHALDRMYVARDVIHYYVTDHANEKARRVERYLHHQGTAYAKFKRLPKAGETKEKSNG